MVVCNPENCKVSSSTPESPLLIHHDIPSIDHTLSGPPASLEEQQKAEPPKPRKNQSPFGLLQKALPLPSRSRRRSRHSKHNDRKRIWQRSSGRRS